VPLNKLINILWRIWPLLGNGSVNTAWKSDDKEQKKEVYLLGNGSVTHVSMTTHQSTDSQRLPKHIPVETNRMTTVRGDCLYSVLLKVIKEISFVRKVRKSGIWNNNIWSRVPLESDPTMTALARSSSNCKRQTRPLVRECAPHQQTHNCLTVIKIRS
jgi:hypothetical protein